MKISVVMSTYNGSKYLKEQLDSLRRQTKKIDQVLIIDDASKDDTVKIAQEYIERYQLTGWQINVNHENKGWRRNFMEGMWASDGDLVFPCDQDDIWREDKVEIMSKIMKTHSKIDLLSSNYLEFFQNGKDRIGPWENDGQLMRVPLPNSFMLVKSPGCTYCVRRRLLALSKKYWKPAYPHDALLWRLGIFRRGLYAIQDDLIRWRKHRSSAFAKESRDLKSVEAKKQWIRNATDFNETLQRYVADDVPGDRTHQQAVLQRVSRWLTTRGRFYQTANPLVGLNLMRYWDCYPRKRQYPGDWYLIYLKRK